MERELDADDQAQRVVAGTNSSNESWRWLARHTLLECETQTKGGSGNHISYLKPSKTANALSS